MLIHTLNLCLLSHQISNSIMCTRYSANHCLQSAAHASSPPSCRSCFNDKGKPCWLPFDVKFFERFNRKTSGYYCYVLYWFVSLSVLIYLKILIIEDKYNKKKTYCTDAYILLQTNTICSCVSRPSKRLSPQPHCKDDYVWTYSVWCLSQVATIDGRGSGPGF